MQVETQTDFGLALLEVCVVLQSFNVPSYSYLDKADALYLHDTKIKILE